MILKLTYRFIKQILLLLALLFISNATAQLYNVEIAAKIKVERNSEFYTFTSTAENLTPAATSLRYEFMAFKTDENNNTQKNTQGNRFVIEANDKKLLSTLTINNNITGKIILVLVIYDLEDKPIGQDRIVLNYDPTLESLEIEDAEKRTPIVISPDQAAPQDGYIPQGFVLKNTITKAGRDFYKYFYFEFYNKQIETDKNILIEEVPGRGRTTRITVKVEDELVWQFFSQPRKAFLKQMANYAIARSIRRLQQLEKQKEELIRY
tara:strand:+ start:2008 stop:2802 length:795 start_codon:yes stop_codon:yes gene_type:complete